MERGDSHSGSCFPSAEPQYGSNSPPVSNAEEHSGYASQVVGLDPHFVHRIANRLGAKRENRMNLFQQQREEMSSGAFLSSRELEDEPPRWAVYLKCSMRSGRAF